jgi:Major Facilitator Superfamily
MSEPTVVVPERAGLAGVAAGAARRWWVLGVVGLAQLMVVLDATIVNIALPSAQRALGFSNADRQWVVTAYSLAFGGLLLLGGRLSDLVGRRRMLVIGLAGFAAASALQLTLAYSPVRSGLAFLPMIAAIVAASTTSSGALMPRTGPRPLIPAGLLLGAGGLALLAARLGLRTSYLDWILPALLLVGAGLGVVFGCALNTATSGTGAADAGVASALVNTNQQVGGSIGTALLNTLAASALASYVLAHGRGPLVLAQAAVHSYVVGFWVSAAILAGSAVVCGLVLPSGTLAPAARPAEPSPGPPAAVTRAQTRQEMTARDR